MNGLRATDSVPLEDLRFDVVREQHRGHVEPPRREHRRRAGSRTRRRPASRASCCSTTSSARLLSRCAIGNRQPVQHVPQPRVVKQHVRARPAPVQRTRRQTWLQCRSVKLAQPLGRRRHRDSTMRKRAALQAAQDLRRAYLARPCRPGTGTACETNSSVGRAVTSRSPRNPARYRAPSREVRRGRRCACRRAAASRPARAASGAVTDDQDVGVPRDLHRSSSLSSDPMCGDRLLDVALVRADQARQAHRGIVDLQVEALADAASRPASRAGSRAGRRCRP